MKRNLYKNNKEIDLRKNFNKLLFGDANSISHNHLVLVRKRKKDSQNKDIKCNCYNSLTKEANTENNCDFCLGEGYIWKETFYRCYSTLIGADGGKANRTRRIEPGSIRTDYKIFYFKFDTIISYKDKIIELRLDNEGKLEVPYQRLTIYRPETIQEYRSDYGRIEYIAVYAREESSIRENQ
jgi:hypothetical protein